MDQRDHGGPAQRPDLLRGEGVLQHAAATLNDRGNYAMALRLVNAAWPRTARHRSLIAERHRALEGLRARYQFKPFKLIVYSEMVGDELH